MTNIKYGHTRISFDFRTPEGAIEFWENFKDTNPEWRDVGLVQQDALHSTPATGNIWLVRNKQFGNGRPVNYQQEFTTVYNMEIGEEPKLNMEV